MTALPYIDDHAHRIEAPADQVWRALLATLRKSFRSMPDWLTAAWGLEPPRRSGAWEAAVAVGDTLPGFAAAEIEPGRLLPLRGRHRFSDYELRFELERAASGGTLLHATSFAAFPGIKGRVYHALVIQTTGHRIAVRRLLASVTRTAQRGN
jgi:hypothetical protein